MDIQGWMISVMLAIVTLVGNGFIIYYVVSELKKNQETIFNRIEKHGDDIVRLNTKAELSMTVNDVDDKYVSKELFRLFEKHIDGRFDRLESGQDKILQHIDKGA